MAKGYSLNLDKVPKELKLQLEIMKCKTTDELKEIDEEWFAHIDWERFLELSYASSCIFGHLSKNEEK